MLALFLFPAVCAYCTKLWLKYACFLEVTYTYTAEKLLYNGLAKAKTAGKISPSGDTCHGSFAVANA